MSIAVQDSLAVDLTGAQALKLKAARGDRDALAGAARQFESMLIAQMLKNMRQASLSADDDPMTGGDNLKLYQELLDQQWSVQLTKGRGLGFADALVRVLQSPGAAGSEAVSPPAMPQPVSPQQTTSRQTAPSPACCAGATSSASPLEQGENGAAQTPSPAASAAGRAQNLTADTFIEQLRPHAERAAGQTGVPADFILAHAALESGWGTREIRDGQGQPSHNLFGIKAGKGWEGHSVETLTTEYRQGMPMKVSQRFRAYDDYGSAFSDYASLLKRRYGAALAEGTEAASFARGLAQGGYATDPAYAGKLQAVIARVSDRLAMAAE